MSYNIYNPTDYILIHDRIIVVPITIMPKRTKSKIEGVDTTTEKKLGIIINSGESNLVSLGDIITVKNWAGSVIMQTDPIMKVIKKDFPDIEDHVVNVNIEDVVTIIGKIDLEL